MRFSLLIFLIIFFVFSLSAKQENNLKQKPIFNYENIFKHHSNIPYQNNKNAIFDLKELQVLDSVKLKLTTVKGYNIITNFTYDNKGNVISKNEVKVTADIPQVMSEYYYKYDNQNRVREEIFIAFDKMSKKMRNISKIESSYKDDKLIETIEYYDPEYNGNWELSTKKEYTYNEKSKLDKELTYYYSNEWFLSLRKTFEYDKNGNLINEESGAFDGTIYHPDEKTDYLYEDNQLRKSIYYYYDENEFVEAGIYLYDYDEKGRVVNSKHSTMLDEAMTPYEESIYQYDANDNLRVHIEREYDEETSKIENSMKFEYQYKMDFTKDQYIIPNGVSEQYIPGNFNNMPINGIVELWFMDNWIGVGDNGVYFYFSPKSVELNVKDIKKSNINVYPNPTIDVLSISLENSTNSADIKIFDVFGKEIISQNLMNSNQINVKSLITGTYIYVINENGVSYSGKIIKE